MEFDDPEKPLSPDKLRFIKEFMYRAAFDLSYFRYEEETIKSSVFYNLATRSREEMLQYCRKQQRRSPVLGWEFDGIKCIDVKALTNDFDKEKLIQRAHHGRLFRANFPGLDHEVTVKTWDFSLIPGGAETTTLLPTKFCMELNFLTKEEMKHKNLANIIGYSCQRLLSVVYDIQPDKCISDLIPFSDIFDWNGRMKLALELASLVVFMHDKQIVMGTIHAKNIMRDKEHNFKLFEIGLHIADKHMKVFTSREFPKPYMYFLESYGMEAEELRNGGMFSFATDTFAYGYLLVELISKRFYGHPYSVKRLTLAANSGVDASFSVDDDIRSQIRDIAISCLDDDPLKRPEMRKVAEDLNVLYGHLLLHPPKKLKTSHDE